MEILKIRVFKILQIRLLKDKEEWLTEQILNRN